MSNEEQLSEKPNNLVDNEHQPTKADDGVIQKEEDPVIDDKIAEVETPSKQADTDKYDPDKISATVLRIRKLCKLWSTMAFFFNIGIVIFGVAAIGCSIFLSVYTASELVSKDTMKLVAYLSTMSLTLLTAFNLIGYSNNSRKAWRNTTVALMRYDAGIYTIKQLIDAYQMGEDTMGMVTFTYGSVAKSDEKDNSPKSS